MFRNNPAPSEPSRVPDDMYDWLVDACQKSWAKKNGK